MVATAGHVDHGKSSLIVRLTGMDPDRWAEEKRRGLTIDLGYAWCTLPSGREIGFVDVPGHERFIGNMLAGVGPVRLVLFVVAADEGWKPQSEEHLQILDVLGVRGGVIALTKRDLVDDETLEIAADEVRERVAGTGLSDAPIVPVSSETGEGVDALASALDVMLDQAGPAEDARTRLHIDRVFTIKGAGTVVTGTLAGGCIDVGDAVEVYPTGIRARIRSLQTHKQAEERACPVSRVAANLVGVERDRLGRGDVLAMPETWRPTRVFDARLRPVRGLSRAITARGAFKLYVGAAEVDARLRLYGITRLEAGQEAFARITTSVPVVLDVGDRFVVRESGRGETVAGGVVLDAGPPVRAGVDPVARLAARASATRDELPARLVDERGAIRAADVYGLTGSRAAGGTAVGEWLVADTLRSSVEASVVEALAAFHAEHPLDAGADLTVARRAVVGGPANRARPDRRGARRRAPQRPERARRHGAGGGGDPSGVAPGGARGSLCRRRPVARRDLRRGGGDAAHGQGADRGRRRSRRDRCGDAGGAGGPSHPRHRRDACARRASGGDDPGARERTASP